MKKLEVHWRDSHRYMYQMHPDEETHVTIIKTLGWLVRETKDSITLCQDDIEGDIRGVIVIPKENVVKRSAA